MRSFMTLPIYRRSSLPTPTGVRMPALELATLNDSTVAYVRNLEIECYTVIASQFMRFLLRSRCGLLQTRATWQHRQSDSVLIVVSALQYSIAVRSDQKPCPAH